MIDPKRLRELTSLLQKYKSGKAALERRIVAAENWWKLRNRAEQSRSLEGDDGGFKSVSGWLHNVIVSKHADAMEAYPEPLILPRESADSGEAHMLSAIIPCILEQNRFEAVYSECAWQKLKTGTGAYRVIWDAERHHGLGDIAIERVDLLNLFWEPGINDLQKSPYLFCTHLEDEEELCEAYPELRGRLRSNAFTATRFVYDDAVSLEGKLTVIECYYKRRGALHYVRYVGDYILFATENSESGAPLYEHGRYPFVLDALFPVEGSPCGYGFVDLCQNNQLAIDLMRTAFVKNTMVGATPRYFQRIDGSVNEQEFADLNRALVHVSGNLGEDSLRQIQFSPLSPSYLAVLESTINELRETSGNTETATGNISAGVTAASAIAALQEASTKGSRDSTRTSYRAFAEIVELCIELVRQFYTAPRSFRITGELGAEQFVLYSNAAIRGDFGLSESVFDVRVTAQKANAYSRLSRNELAMELYRMGIFAPGRESEALACLALMDFDGRDELMQSLAENMAVSAQMQSALAPAASAE